MRFLLALIFVSCMSQAQTTQKYPSLLWKITGNGLKAPSYLYGTMHVSNRVAWHLSDEFFTALKSVDVVGLETSPAAWLDNMQKTGELAEMSRSQLNLSDESDFYSQAFKTTFPEQKMLRALISYDPDIINGLLYRQNGSREEFEENTYVDLFIFQTAEKLNKPVISLENFVEAEIQSKLAAIPDEEPQHRFYNGEQNKGHLSIEDAYRAGNLDLLDSLSKMSSSQNAQKYLIDVRNTYFVHTIDSVLQHQTLFSGVGAAHLPGPNGVIELLRKQGYTLEPVFGKVSKRSSTQREKLGALEKELNFSKYFGPDSLYSILLPGKLYPIFESPALSYHIQPDMVNGHFFTAVRLRHYGTLFGFSPEQMRARVDSLLFENIAGKIIEKKSLNTNSDWLGFEVLSITVRGDEQRYQFYLNENELLMFKLGAKAHYASSKEGNRYFSAIQFPNQTSTEIVYSPPSAGFKLKLKQAPCYFFSTSNGKGLVEELLNSNKNQSIWVQHAVYNDFNYLEEDTFELVQFAKKTLENYQYQLRGSYSLIKSQNFPAIRFQALNAYGRRLDGKLIIKGVHYYLVLLSSAANSVADYTAFDSFELTDFKYLHPVKKIKDEEFLFTVNDEVTDDGASQFNEKLSSAYHTAFPDTAKKSNKDESYRSGSKQYFSPSSNEYVNILFEKYDYFDYRNKTKLIQKIDSVISHGSSMRLTNSKINEDKNLLRYEFVMRDTATSRAIAYKLFFGNSTLHELSAPYDTIIGLKGYPKAFFESFAPLDSAAGPSLFEPKFSDIVSALLSKDSAKVERAQSAINDLGFSEEYASEFIKLINDKKFGTIDQKTRAKLLVTGGTLKTDAIIEPYKLLYNHYTDSFYLQLCILKGLAYLSTDKSIQTFADLISNSTPLIGDESLVKDVFSILYDSLPLCRKLYPNILKIAKYEEYKTSVYALLADLTKRGYLPTTILSKEQAELMADAQLFYKRWSQRSQNENATNQNSEVNEILSANGYQNIFPNSNASAIKERPQLLNYVVLLAPYYAKDEKAKLWIDKVLTVKDLSISLPALVAVMRCKAHVNDTLLRQLSNSILTRAILFHQMKEADLENLIPKEGLTQESLVRSLIYSQEFSKLILNDKKVTDSLLLVKILPVKNRYENGQLYIYKKAGNKKLQSTWQLAFVNEKDGSLSDQIRLVDNRYFPDPQKSEQEQYLELQDHFSKLYRNRAGNQAPF
jgi:uncharacterized protein YbaP (TraB family)